MTAGRDALRNAETFASTGWGSTIVYEGFRIASGIFIQCGVASSMGCGGGAEGNE